MIGTSLLLLYPGMGHSHTFGVYEAPRDWAPG